MKNQVSLDEAISIKRGVAYFVIVCGALLLLSIMCDLFSLFESSKSTVHYLSLGYIISGIGLVISAYSIYYKREEMDRETKNAILRAMILSGTVVLMGIVGIFYQ